MTDKRNPEDPTTPEEPTPTRTGAAPQEAPPPADPTSHTTLEAGASPITPQPTMQPSYADDEIPPEPESITEERTAGRSAWLLLAIGILIGVALYFLIR